MPSRSSSTEVGLAFLAANLVTGSIWGRIIWGIWWTWDARLTSALVCWLLYAGYLMLRRAIEEPTAACRIAAVFNIFAFTDVPIVFFSIKWWRTQHPAAGLLGRRQHRSGHASDGLLNLLALCPAGRGADAHPPAPGGSAARNRFHPPLRPRRLDGARFPMDTRNFTFMFYGFLAAWLILVIYVLSLVSRERKIAEQLKGLKGMLDDKDTKVRRLMNRRNLLRAWPPDRPRSLPLVRENAEAQTAQATRALPRPVIKDVTVIATAPAGLRLSVVKITTDQDGLYGYGCATFTQRAELVNAAVEKYLQPVSDRQALPTGSTTSGRPATTAPTGATALC